MARNLITALKGLNTGYTKITFYYLLIYIASGAFSFLPVYLQTGAGFDTAQIGVLLSFGPMVALLAPFLWGRAADRAPHRNGVLAVLLGGTALFSFLLPLHVSFTYVAVMLVLYNFFATPMSSIGDSVMADLCAQNRWDYGRSRTPGALGYALSTLGAGILLGSQGGSSMFIFYAAVIAVALIPVLRMPRVGTRQSHAERVPFRTLFKNRPLVVLFAVNFVVFLTSSFYYSFFSVYFISPEVGGTTAQFGLCNALASLAEFPFMLLAVPIIARFGISMTMSGSIFLLALRWLLIGLFPDPTALIFINMLHGFSYASLFYCGIVFINEAVPPSLKASGQAVNGMICLGITKVLASIFGGYIANAIGFRLIFIAMAVVIALLFIVFHFVIHRRGWLTAAQET